MSSFIAFPGDRTACIWNSSFTIIRVFLEERAPGALSISAILEANPICETIKYLNLTALAKPELADLQKELALLAEAVPARVQLDYAPQFLRDMETIFDNLDASIADL